MRTNLFDSGLAARALSFARDVADALCEPRPDETVDLADGAAGIAVAHAHFARAFPEHADVHIDAMVDSIELALRIERITSRPMSLLVGLPGLGWALEHIRHVFPDLALPDVGSIDDTILATLQAEGLLAFDVTFGVAGLALFALERKPRGAWREIAEGCVDFFARTAERSASGITWRTPIALATFETRSRHPHGYHDVGVAHGVSGVACALARLSLAGVRPQLTGELLRGACRWLLGVEQPIEQSRFPGFVGRDIEPVPSRLAWCYGDPGVALALAHCGLALEDREVLRRALTLAKQCARRFADNTVIDGSICHGSAGLVAILDHIDGHIRPGALSDEIETWIRRTLDFRMNGGTGGYRYWNNQEGCWESRRGLMVGAAGAALSLLRAMGMIGEWGAVFAF